MIRTLLAAGLMAATAAVSGCTTMEPEPCTAEWVDWKKERILKDFTSRYSREITELRRLSSAFDNRRDATVLIRLASVAEDVRDMVEYFRDVTVPDVRASLAQCGTSPKALTLLAEVLRSERVDEEAIAWVEALNVVFDDR